MTNATPDGAAGDQALVAAAVAQVRAAAPAGWTRMRVRFEPPVTQAWVLTEPGPQAVEVPVPAEPVGLLSEYQRRAAVAGARWHTLVIDCDPAGSLTLTIDPTAVAAAAPAQPAVLPPVTAPAPESPPLSRRRWLLTALWAVAAVASATLLGVAVAGRDRGGGPTLRAMAANESMSDQEALAVADNTARVWARERNAGHLDNMEALSCPDPGPGRLADALATAREHKAITPLNIVATARLTRDGPVWTLDVFSKTLDQMFTMRILNGELRVCALGAAPVPDPPE